jgi:pilus assembly protein CpaC
MLKVRFLEVARSAGRELGVNTFVSNPSGTRGVNTGLGGLTSLTPQTCAPSGACPPAGNSIFQTVGTLVGASVGQPFGTILAQIVNNGTKIDALVTALENKGLLQRLAEPNLIALSGQTASFQAGGQIPVPIAVTSGIGVATPTIEYKDFGVLLRFRPTVLSNGIINLSINPEVSELDFSNAVTISGTTIPALTRRTATTTVELRDGQSFAIAGLLQTDNNRTIAQLPWIGSVPVLGTLFRSSSYQKAESDLVIIVTPQLVVPAVPGARLATPLDNTVPSNDVDFFLLGQMERRKQYTDYVSHRGEIQGPYGHMIGVAQEPYPPAQQPDPPGASK